MKFCQQLSAYLRFKEYTGRQLYQDMFDQAILSDQGGYDSVGLTEHHLINILMMPAPLHFAVKIAEATKNIKIITSVAVLPLHDMRVFAGELIASQIFTNDRLILGVGRGAFDYEMSRLDSPLEDSREKFNESLEVLKALLSEEEVSWKGKYYNFDPLTVMPRPMTINGPDIMMAVLNPEGIYACTKRGFHIMTTPLSGDHQLMLDQVDGFMRGKAELGDKGKDLTYKAILMLKDLANKANARFYIFIIPNKQLAMQNQCCESDILAAEFRKFSESNNLNLIDLAEVFGKYPEQSKLFFKKNSHFTSLGHSVTAKAISSKLELEEK